MPNTANGGQEHTGSRERAVRQSWTSGHLALTLPREKLHLSSLISELL